MRDHTKLRAFELADQLAVNTYRLTATFPRHELYGLISQMRRAAVSVPTNIVEGCARNSTTEYLRFLNIAFGSLRELHYQINLSQKLGFIGVKESEVLENLVIENEKVLNALIRAIRVKDSVSN